LRFLGIGVDSPLAEFGLGVVDVAGGHALHRLWNSLVFEVDFCFRRLPPETISAVTVAITKWDIIYFAICIHRMAACAALSSRLTSDCTVGGHFYAVNGPFICPMLKFTQETGHAFTVTLTEGRCVETPPMTTCESCGRAKLGHSAQSAH
jgi:hypothetical protein